VCPDCGGSVPLDLVRCGCPILAVRHYAVSWSTPLLGAFAVATTCERQSLPRCRGRACSFHCATLWGHQTQARPRACGSAFCRSGPGIGTSFARSEDTEVPGMARRGASRQSLRAPSCRHGGTPRHPQGAQRGRLAERRAGLPQDAGERRLAHLNRLAPHVGAIQLQQVEGVEERRQALLTKSRISCAEMRTRCGKKQQRSSS
jgi:hypothetical protein